ncbi:MAG: hypothetical protein K8S16_21150 [Bacteroidales bacterium]|nr:hypothetical protein [Bacteroidales bacterium]
MRKVIFSTVISFFLFAGISLAQSPPHPNGGSAPGSNATPVGGAASLSSGLLLLIGLASGYAAKKGLNIRKKLMD